MACPTCDHTMEMIDTAGRDNLPWYWCPRCGTIKQHIDECTAPKLVQRCIEFAGKLPDDLADEFERCGILESILPPDLRNAP